MRLILIAALLTVAALTSPALADQKDVVVFHEDPAYKPISEGDEHPMSDLIKLAEGGDTRAQFILGDLYAKGKGGLIKSAATAEKWFNESALNGYGPSFIRLGALARTRGDFVAAWAWYDLGSDYAGGKDGRYAGEARDRLEDKENLSSEDLDAARQRANAWRDLRSAAINERAEAERLKKEEARLKEEAAAAKKADTPKSDKKKDDKKEAAEDSDAPATWQQTYND